MIEKNYINNLWQDPSDGNFFPVENPFTEKIIGTAPNSSANDVDKAVSSAKLAWKEWKLLGSIDMRDLLREIAVKSRKHDKELADAGQ